MVLTPKDPSRAKTDAERAKIQRYNDAHPLGPSDNKAFDVNSLGLQRAVTDLAKEHRDAKRQVANEQAKEQQANLTAEAAVAEPSL